MLFWLVYFLVRRLSEPEVADQTKRTSGSWCSGTR
jgi:hypothetical protein